MEKSNISKSDEQNTTQVRGPALREKMIESHEMGKEFREHNPEDETQKSQRGHKKTYDECFQKSSSGRTLFL